MFFSIYAVAFIVIFNSISRRLPPATMASSSPETYDMDASERRLVAIITSHKDRHVTPAELKEAVSGVRNPSAFQNFDPPEWVSL